MRTFNFISIMLLACCIVGLAAWGAVASVSYNWATEHTGVKRDVAVPFDHNETVQVADSETSGLYCTTTLWSPGVSLIQVRPPPTTLKVSTRQDLA
jgi:hypothetical protein